MTHSKPRPRRGVGPFRSHFPTAADPQRPNAEPPRGSQTQRQLHLNDPPPKGGPVSASNYADPFGQEGGPNRTEKPTRDLNSRLAAVSSSSANQTTKQGTAVDPTLPSPPPTAVGVQEVLPPTPTPAAEDKSADLLDLDKDLDSATEKGEPSKPAVPAFDAEAVGLLVGLVNRAGDFADGDSTAIDLGDAERFRGSPLEPIYIAAEGLFARLSKAKSNAQAQAHAQAEALAEAQQQIQTLQAKKPEPVTGKIEPKAPASKEQTEQLTRMREVRSFC